MTMAATTKHPACAHHQAAASEHEAAAHHHREACHHLEQCEHEEAKVHATSAHSHSQEAERLTKAAHTSTRKSRPSREHALGVRAEGSSLALQPVFSAHKRLCTRSWPAPSRRSIRNENNKTQRAASADAPRNRTELPNDPSVLVAGRTPPAAHQRGDFANVSLLEYAVGDWRSCLPR